MCDYLDTGISDHDIDHDVPSHDISSIILLQIGPFPREL
jgi:hypothetical protein